MTKPEWLDEEAGPVVRPFALIRGRTRSSGDKFDLIAVVAPTGAKAPAEAIIGPEQQRILALAEEGATVAEVASELDLPLGVVRVLLGDLKDHGLIEVRPPAQVAPLPSERILKEVIHGLRAL